MNIILSEHAWYKTQTRSSAPGDVMRAVQNALEDRTRLHRLERSDEYMITADDLRIVVRLEGDRAVVITVLQSTDQAA